MTETHSAKARGARRAGRAREPRLSVEAVIARSTRWTLETNMDKCG